MKTVLKLKSTVTRREPAAAFQQPPKAGAKLELPPAARFQEILQKRFKALADFLPLAIGVKEQLLAMATAGELPMTPTELADALGYHCTRTKYLKAMANDGSFRHDLDGNPTHPVADGHRAYACWRLLNVEAAAKRRKAN